MDAYTASHIDKRDVPLAQLRRELRCDDERFPHKIRERMPQVETLYVRGQLDFSLPLIAIIGAREASPYGLAAAELVARWAVEAGFAVISGCARGCDQKAHISTLKLGGKTMAVLGCGADLPYPRGATKLLDRIAESSGVLSLYEWGTPAAPFRFVQRNRVIAALADLLVVCEGKLPSGTFSTVEHANSFGVSVAAVPGSIFSALSCGPNRLISDGAYAISSKDDFNAVLGLVRESLPEATERPSVSPLLRALRADAYHPSDLSARLKIPISKLNQELLELELEGVVTRYRDGRFAILKK